MISCTSLHEQASKHSCFQAQMGSNSSTAWRKHVQNCKPNQKGILIPLARAKQTSNLSKSRTAKKNQQQVVIGLASSRLQQVYICVHGLPDDDLQQFQLANSHARYSQSYSDVDQQQQQLQLALEALEAGAATLHHLFHFPSSQKRADRIPWSCTPPIQLPTSCSKINWQLEAISNIYRLNLCSLDQTIYLPEFRSSLPGHGSTWNGSVSDLSPHVVL